MSTHVGGPNSKLVRQCAALGIGHVWLHRSFGQGSVSGFLEAFGKPELGFVLQAVADYGVICFPEAVD